MASIISASKTTPAQAEEPSLEERLGKLRQLTRLEHDHLVIDIATLLDGPDRNKVFEALTITTLSQFLMPSPVDYDNYFDFQRAANESRRLFNNMGLFEVSSDGRIVDRNTLHRPINEDGSFYSKQPDGPAIIEV